ncbi:hypothetical protein PMAC_001289 [Pneumocystis sp. 'macacae']|nr:hypothetical protein PMAC_001289 [Pneumocystis sp. 'macacae']
MDPLISWILFLGISGTVYVALRGMPCLAFSMEDKAASGRVDAASFSKRIRKRRRVDRPVDEIRLEQRIHKAERPEQVSELRIDKVEPRIYRLEQAEQASLHQTDAPISTFSHVSTNKSFTSLEPPKTESLQATLTKKQKQNALKREKQKLLKARMEEERLHNLYQHQKILEEERQRALIHKQRLSKPSMHAWLPRAVSDEWTVVGARGAQYVQPVASTMI